MTVGLGSKKGVKSDERAQKAMTVWATEVSCEDDFATLASNTGAGSNKLGMRGSVIQSVPVLLKDVSMLAC